MTVVGVIIEISGGNVRNNHFYLKDAKFLLPESVIGGPNKSGKAASNLTIEFVPGNTVETDVASDKMILRERGAVKDFFESAGVKEGDRIIFENIGPLRFRVRKLCA